MEAEVFLDTAYAIALSSPNDECAGLGSFVPRAGGTISSPECISPPKPILSRPWPQKRQYQTPLRRFSALTCQDAAA